MKYIFMGEIRKKTYYISSYDLEARIKYENDGLLSGGYSDYMRYEIELYFPDPYEKAYKYYHILNNVVETKKFSETTKIEYKIEKGSTIKLYDKIFSVKNIQINEDGSVTCFTDHVLELIDNGKSEEWAKLEVIRIYEELKEESKKNQPIKEEEKIKQGFWIKLKNYFKGD